VGAPGPPLTGAFTVVTVRLLDPPSRTAAPANPVFGDRHETGGRLPRKVLRRLEPRVEHDPAVSSENAAGRIGGYYGSIKLAVDAAVTLDLDVPIARAHSPMGFWLARLAAPPLSTPPRPGVLRDRRP